ncbi:hypothetical protein AVEN_242495-1 [Araneus ventricosus]|uniref:Uncharacterized protein n=1 Tax=Araneus ventricosus TaxID=182803 RepID=A0A4Y2E4Y5_ARAVE|nr:hypothetical protein AVEN_242495-1 [Araneus ventricosus]
MTLSLNYSREGVTSLDNRFWTRQRVGGTAEEHESEEKGFGFYLLIVIGFWVTVGSNIFIPAEGGETAPFWGSMRKFRANNDSMVPTEIRRFSPVVFHLKRSEWLSLGPYASTEFLYLEKKI